MKQYNETCPVCGKLFFVGDRCGYVYKRDLHYMDGGKRVFYCSWTCYRSFEKRKGEKANGTGKKD